MLTLQVLEQHGWTEGFFATWFSHLDVFRKVHDKKLVIITLSELLIVPVEQLPESLRVAWPQLLGTILSVFKTLPQAEQSNLFVLECLHMINMLTAIVHRS